MIALLLAAVAAAASAPPLDEDCILVRKPGAVPVVQRVRPRSVVRAASAPASAPKARPKKRTTVLLPPPAKGEWEIECDEGAPPPPTATILPPPEIPADFTPAPETFETRSQPEPAPAVLAPSEPCECFAEGSPPGVWIGWPVAPSWPAPIIIRVEHVPTPIPEPGAWALLLAGLAATSSVWRRKA